MQQQLHGHNPNSQPSYAVYSFQYQESEKKGQNWRSHGNCSSKEEALWIAEQLTKCDTVERVEIRLQKQDTYTNSFREKRVKLIDKNSKSDGLFAKIRQLFH